MHTARTYLLQYILTVTSTGAAGYFFFEPYRAIDPTRCSREPTNRLAVDCLCNPRRPPLEYRKVDTDFQMGAQWQWGCGSRLAVQIAQVRPRPGGAAFSMNPPPCLLTRTPSIMTIIKVKQPIIDKVGVRCTRRAGNTSGQCHCRTPTWHAYIHDLTSYRLLYTSLLCPK